jgi:hypothetical protein
MQFPLAAIAALAMLLPAAARDKNVPVSPACSFSNSRAGA